MQEHNRSIKCDKLSIQSLKRITHLQRNRKTAVTF